MGFLAAKYPELRNDVRFELVASAGDINLVWSDLPADAPERATIDELLAASRLLPPRVEPDPWWRLIVALWGCIDDPYGFARFALERALSRSPAPEDARRVRDDICERYSQSHAAVGPFGRALQVEDFQTTPQASPRLEIGREVTLARLRDRQYMPRPGRADALCAKLEGRHEVSRLGIDPAVYVVWHGRSGVGKSVLLVQLLERLVREGRRVLWLAGAAEELERTLRAVADQPEHLRPEFIGIDDLYDSDARSRLDLDRLGAFVDERGPAAWPLVLTCGPSEFADAFHQDAGFRGFEMHREIVLPLAAGESARFAGWFRVRTHQSPKPAEAFIQAQGQEGGLFVSLAVELQHGDLREFARRFAERINLQSMEQALRLPLALNRLYLRAPYGWLATEDREKLATLNAEGDFAVLEPGSEDREIRLTHPHLSDAIYRALRRPSNALAYAHDLGEAFERAQLDVWLTAANPSKGFVSVTTANASGVNPAAMIAVGTEYEGVVSGAQDYGLFRHIHGRQGLIRSNKFPPGENVYARHPAGSAMTVRVISITERGLELEPVFVAAVDGDTRIEAVAGGTDDEAVRHALTELRKRSHEEALSDDDMAWIAEQYSQPHILSNTEVLFRFPPFNADTFRSSSGQSLLSVLLDALTYHVSSPDLTRHIARHISRLFAFLSASVEPSSPIPEYPRIRKALTLWIRNPISFLEPIPSDKAPIGRLVEEIGLLIASGELARISHQGVDT